MDARRGPRGLASRKQPQQQHHQRDSGSESAPLLSSGCSSKGHRLRDSETSDLDCSVAGSSLCRFSSISGVNTYNSISFLLPASKKGEDHSSIGRLLHSDRENDRCCEIHNTDLLLKDNTFDESKQPDQNHFFTNFFKKKSLSIQTNIIEAADEIKPKQSSVVTIFSIWNTILGSSMLTMPWGIYMAGFIPAIILIITMSGICLLTAYKLLQVHKYYGGGEKFEVMELSRVLLGSWAEYVAKIFSVSVLMGANIAYWILMSNFLYNSVNFLYEIIGGSSEIPINYNNGTDTELLCLKEETFNKSIIYENSHGTLGPLWDLYKTVPIFLSLLVFPALNFNTTTFFTKFNSLGTIAIIYLIVFVVIKSASWGINMDKTNWIDNWMLKSTFPVLTGMLTLSFFIHNIIITIMQSNRNQHKNGRDLTIAYVLVTSTYIIVGIVFYICFPLPKLCIEDNLLNNFQKNDGLTIGARIVLLFQLFTVYPLLAYMLRIQLLSSIFKKTECRKSCVLILNLFIVIVCVLFAIFLPHVGTIIRYTGAISGSVYVFTLPSLLYLTMSYRQGTITTLQVVCYSCVPIIGVLNLVSQFFIQTT